MLLLLADPVPPVTLASVGEPKHREKHADRAEDTSEQGTRVAKTGLRRRSLFH
jgi:hypothetical protein